MLHTLEILGCAQDPGMYQEKLTISTYFRCNTDPTQVSKPIYPQVSENFTLM